MKITENNVRIVKAYDNQYTIRFLSRLNGDLLVTRKQAESIKRQIIAANIGAFEE